MNPIVITKKDEIVMRLVHYFITEEDYTPIIVNGVKDEVWLENNTAKYKIVRINSNYIHNKEQYWSDVFKIQDVMRQVKRKTFSFSMNTFNIFLNINDDIKIENSKNVKSISLKNATLEETDKIKAYFPGIENKLMQDTEGLELILNVTEDINKKNEKNNKIYESTFRPKKIVVTYALMLLCIIMFILTYIATCLNGNGTLNSIDSLTLYKFGGVFKTSIKSGQIFRLLTGTFLHAGIVHLIVNMYSLYVVGTQLETFLGKKKFLVVYLASAISGSLMSCVFSSYLSVGASGAIFGLLGSMLYFGYHYRLYLGNALKAQIIPIIVINLALGFLMSGIDSAAHIGGLVGGYLITSAVGITGKSTKKDQINGTIVFALYIIFLVFMLFYS